GMSIFSIHLPKSFKPLSRFVRMRCPPYTPCLPGFPDSSPSSESCPPTNLLAQIGWHAADRFLIAAIQPVGGAPAPARMLSALTSADHCCVMAGNQLCLLI